MSIGAFIIPFQKALVKLSGFSYNIAKVISMKNTFQFITQKKRSKSVTNYFVRENVKEKMKLKATATCNRMILICNGNVDFNIGGKVYNARYGDLLFIFKNELFYAVDENKCEYMYIDFDGEKSVEKFEELNINTDNRIFSGFQKLIPFWNQAFSKIGNIKSDLVAESTLVYSFSKFNETTPENNSIFYKIYEIVEQRFNDPDLSMNLVSSELCYNRKYLSYYYKKEFGVGFMEHLTHTKIQFAMTLFRHGIKIVRHAAYLAGYNDPYYFSTIFKEKMGITPTEYINSI